MKNFVKGEKVKVDGMGTGETEYGIYVEENGTYEGERHVVIDFWPKFHHAGCDPVGKSEYTIPASKVFKIPQIVEEL